MSRRQPDVAYDGEGTIGIRPPIFKILSVKVVCLCFNNEIGSIIVTIFHNYTNSTLLIFPQKKICGIRS